MGCKKIMQIKNIEHTITIELTDTIGKDKINYYLLRDSRVKQKHSIHYVSKKTGKDISTLSKYERGEYLPLSWFILKALCLGLSLSPDELLGIKDSPQDNMINIPLLKKYREVYNKLSIRKLSKQLGLYPTTAKHYEHSCTIPHAWLFLKKLCVLLDISVNDLFGIVVDKKVEKNVEVFTAIYNYLDKT